VLSVLALTGRLHRWAPGNNAGGGPS
jgi:hypothetical protein